jgi:hypothetical protein
VSAALLSRFSVTLTALVVATWSSGSSTSWPSCWL